MKTVSQLNRFKALDACHLQMQQHLAELAALTERLEADAGDTQARQAAGVIEGFFSKVSRQHHAEEEQKIFPALLVSDNAELIQAVRTLQQDHNWIELNWLELAPMLRAIAQGEDWVDSAEFRHTVEVFTALCNDHLALEETLIYPEAKQRFAQEVAGRAQRLSA